MRAPTPADIRIMLSDICINSGADLAFEKFNFSINGSDDAVKAAMIVINDIQFVRRAQYQMRVKIELANEHKEFVSGKKNGKINKIMGQSKHGSFILVFLVLNRSQVMCRLSLTALTSTIFTLTFAEDSTRPPRTDSILWSKKCLPRFRSMFQISTTNASSVSAANTYSVS